MQEYKNSKLKQNACIQVQTKNFFSFHLVLPNQQCNQIQHGGKISKKALFGYVCMEQGFENNPWRHLQDTSGMSCNAGLQNQLAGQVHLCVIFIFLFCLKVMVFLQL